MPVYTSAPSRARRGPVQWQSALHPVTSSSVAILPALRNLCRQGIGFETGRGPQASKEGSNPSLGTSHRVGTSPKQTCLSVKESHPAQPPCRRRGSVGTAAAGDRRGRGAPKGSDSGGASQRGVFRIFCACHRSRAERWPNTPGGPKQRPRRGPSSSGREGVGDLEDCPCVQLRARVGNARPGSLGVAERGAAPGTDTAREAAEDAVAGAAAGAAEGAAADAASGGRAAGGAGCVCGSPGRGPAGPGGGRKGPLRGRRLHGQTPPLPAPALRSPPHSCDPRPPLIPHPPLPGPAHATALIRRVPFESVRPFQL